ncbi:MAG TPA: S8 family serine peptidase [Thermoanaerobaculia bacterium]|jgi:subtilisin family serine protease|nr:S8 family serine peptidase [Thermoanaerobaculia bacterium]
MKRLLLVLSLLASHALFAADTHRYIVLTTPEARASRIRALNTAGGTERNLRTFESITGFAAGLTDDEAAAMRKSAGVRSVGQTIPVYAVGGGNVQPASITTRPASGPLATMQVVPPNIDLVHARDVWRLTRGGGVNIVIFDTGVDIAHADLAANISGGYNTFTGLNDFNDDNFHGTHVFGIIGALDNNIGVVGVSPEARIYSVKALDRTGSGTDENLVAAADWVIAKKHTDGGNWIVSMSLGSIGITDAEAAAFQRLIDEGVLCVAAAGNDGWNQLLYPAALPGVVSVGAVDNSKVIASFSNSASTLNVVAPGVSVLSTLPMGSVHRAETRIADSTVVAAAQVTGAPLSTVTGQWVYCNYGAASDFPAETAGRIAVIMRGNSITFSEKVRNARTAGAIGAVIINNNPEIGDTGWTLINFACDATGCHSDPSDLSYDWPVVVAMSAADGATLMAGAKDQAITVSAWQDDYGILSGTSMATPHVTGVAALIWSLAPSATARQVAGALRATAIDLGPPGVDDVYGYGFIDARAAAQWLSPAVFGLPPHPDVRQRGVRP